MKKYLIVSHFWNGFLTTIITFSIVIGVIGCAATGDRGSLQRDRDLNNRIVAYEVLPDHNYYFSGSFGRPNAILGIHNDYQLVSDLWQSVQVDSLQMRKWISAISPDAMRGTAGYFAAYILDPDGKRVGFWYSIQSNTTIRFPGENKVEVFTPSLNQPTGGPRRRF
jgi:hypothetical protein